MKHFSEWERAGVTRIWLRNSDLSDRYPKPDANCDYSYTGNYNQWAADEPKCRETSNSCAYATTSATSNNWLADYCSLAEAFACEIEPGKMLHSAEKPVNDHHCPESGHWKSEWTLNTDNNKCYLIGRNSIDDGSGLAGNNFTFAREYCTKRGSELVSIHSMEENSWLVPRLVGNIWLGMKMSSPGVVPQVKGHPMAQFKGSPDPSHFIVEINVGKCRIRHTCRTHFPIVSKLIQCRR